MGLEPRVLCKARNSYRAEDGIALALLCFVSLLCCSVRCVNICKVGSREKLENIMDSIKVIAGIRLGRLS